MTAPDQEVQDRHAPDGALPDEAAEVRRRLAEALGEAAPVNSRRLDGGLYNTARLVELADGRRMVLKTAPDANTPALTHEHALLATERLFHRLAADAGLPVPAVHHHRPAGPDEPAEWMLLDYLDGTTWDSARDAISAADRARLRRDLGRLAARIATVTGPAFGYPQPVPGLAAADWPTAFTGMLRAVLADADRYAVDLPAPAPVLARLPERCAAALARVRRPALVHFDAWEGNIVLAADPAAGGALRIAGLIDGERAFFGDPLAELVGLDPLGAAEDDPDLVAGYRLVDPDLRIDDAARVRLALYRIYLALIMLVEAVPRDYGAGHRAWLTTWSAERIGGQLALLERLEGAADGPAAP